MKKRAKIIAIVSTLCLCLSLFIVGVLSAITTSLSVTSTIGFKSNGAYVMVDGQLRQGATKDSATLQSGAPATYKYKGYSYNCIGGTGADKDKPDGTASLENFVDASGASNATWAIGEINFTNELPVAVYHFTFTNYSAMMVIVSVSSNIQELNTDLAGKVRITENFESGSTIDAYDGTTAKTIVYTITVEITDYTTSFEDKQLELTVQFDTAELNRDYFTYNTAGTRITGLSEKYFEDNPTVLIVPAYSESGQKLTINAGGYSSPTFNGLVSPTVILQEGLTSVPNYAFSDCSSLSSIILPEGVTSIGERAFRNCSSLSSISLPESVTSIGSGGTFSGCSSLSSINIPDGVTSIGSSAFDDCSSLSSIILPNSVTSIGSSAFRDCSSLSSINIPDAVTSIGERTFYGCSSLSSINIPDGVTSIGDSAFYYCSSLSTINIPDGVTSIGDRAFQNCSSLTSITIPEGVTSIGDSAFYYCSSLSSITIPSGVTSIGNSAFDGCRSLSSITIPESVTSIGAFAFYFCYALVEVYNYSPSITVNKGGTTPSNNGYLGQYALYIYNANDGTEPEPTKISVDGNVQYYTDGTDIIAIGTFGNRNAINEITFKDGTTKINTRAFDECYALTSVTLPSSVTSIGGSAAFSFCYALAEVYNYSSLNVSSYFDYEKVIHTTNEQTKILKEDGMQYYPNDDGTYIALSPIDRSSIKEVNIKAGTTEINQYAFYDCSSLSSISLPNSVTGIGNYAFQNCSSLSSINIPDGVTSIDKYAFYGCSSLSSINIPDGVTSIGNYVFYNCSSLTSITIPEGVTSIGNSAFYGCNNLTLDLTKVVWADLTLGSNSIHPTSSGASIVIIVAENVDFETIIKPRLTTAVDGSFSDTIQIKQGSTTYVWKGSSTGWVEQTA